MWAVCFVASVGCLLFSAILLFAVNGGAIVRNRKFNLFNTMFAGVFLAAVFVFYPIHWLAADATLLGGWRAFLLSLYNAMQVFAIGCDYGGILDALGHCPNWLAAVYPAWAATLFVLAPVLTFGFVLSLFKNLSEHIKYLLAFFKDVFVFSELNQKSLMLANDIRAKHRKCAIVFTDVFAEKDELTYELVESAKQLGAICFKKDILVVNFKNHAENKAISFFTLGDDETENLNQGLKLIENYRDRNNVNLYIFSAKVESELLLTAVDKGKIKVRRINEVQSLINRILYEHGEILFESAGEKKKGIKNICAVVVGMGGYGTEMVKALTWFGQMDGYRIEINAFDKDPLAEEKFSALAPELMDSHYNGVEIEGEAQYKITIHSGVDVETASFAKVIAGLQEATYVFIALGKDDTNINAAVKLRMYFERMKVHPVIQAIVHNSRQKKALSGIRNYRGQDYDIGFIGDIESSYAENVIIDSELEEDALKRHLKWGNEEEFWTYEYNYRSSIASAIHMRARIKCGIPGADKEESELTEKERNTIEVLEHRRWNAYMRAEGYVFSGSKEKTSRNDLAKMHHDLVDFASLSEEEKRKDGKVGTQ